MSLATLVGLISDAEGEKLAELAAQVPADQAIVELGSYRGKSTAYLASAGHHVYAVDRWTMGGQRIKGMGYDAEETWFAFRHQIENAGVADRVSPIVGDTVAVADGWKEPVGLLFIDADHSEAAVRADLAAWEPHLAEGAVVAFDDYAPRWPGVVRVADDLMARRAERFELVDRLAVVWT